jgi:biopolymer transport protein ExbB/TolQ
VLIDRLERVALLGSAWVLYLLLALSVVSISVMIERWVFFMMRRDDVWKLGDEVVLRLRRGDRGGAEALLDKSRSIEAAVLRHALPWMDGGPESFAEALEAAMGRKRGEIERGMTFLGTLGNNAPFVGLFGTVLGVIQAFHQLGEGQSKAAMGNVMSGIAEALIATGVGLVVALPAVVGYNIAQQKIGVIEGNVSTLGKQIVAFLKFDEKAAGKAPDEAHAEAAPASTNGKASEASEPRVARPTIEVSDPAS